MSTSDPNCLTNEYSGEEWHHMKADRHVLWSWPGRAQRAGKTCAILCLMQRVSIERPEHLPYGWINWCLQCVSREPLREFYSFETLVTYSRSCKQPFSSEELESSDSYTQESPSSVLCKFAVCYLLHADFFGWLISRPCGWKQYIQPKSLLTSTDCRRQDSSIRLYGVTFQNNLIFMVIFMRTSSLT
jgi:hypothetical protein